MDEISIEDARRKLGDITDRARLAGQATVITRHGKAAAVVVPALTDADRRIIAEARELAGDDLADAGHDDALDYAQNLIGKLLAITGRLDG